MDASSGTGDPASTMPRAHGPASLTKMMTGYVVSGGDQAGKVKWEDPAHIRPERLGAEPVFAGSSLMWVDINADVSLKDLYYGLVISSGNDASVAIAEHVAGSEQPLRTS